MIWTDPAILHWYRNPDADNIHTEPCLECDKVMAEGNHRPPRRSVAGVTLDNENYAQQIIDEPAASYDAKVEAHRFIYGGADQSPDKIYTIMCDRHDINTGVLLWKDNTYRDLNKDSAQVIATALEKEAEYQNIRIYEFTPKLISIKEL